MAYQATVIPVMIASPGDVSEEREIIRSTIHDWNDVNAATSKVMLAPAGWDTHSAPELGTRPQELINSRILRDCDLLIGVFWTRLGTPTGKAESGTVEEIEEHISAGKPAMIYFSSRPVAPESIDAKQFAEVQAFKQKCRGIGLIEQFDDATQFREKFSKQLPICLAKNHYLQSLVPKVSVAASVAPLTMAVSRADSGLLRVLTGEAKTLLKAAASDKNGMITKLTLLSGREIRAGEQVFGAESARESAKWENALKELITARLVAARGYKDQVFELTHLGWSVADGL